MFASIFKHFGFCQDTSDDSDIIMAIPENVPESIRGPLTNKKPPGDLMPKEVYKAIDWNRCLIGGSYALKQYLPDGDILAQWIPSDVDIFGIYDDHNEFDRECLIFQQKANLELLKEVYNDAEILDCPELREKIKSSMVIKTSNGNNNNQVNNNNVNNNQANSDDRFVEDFDHAIIGTKTYIKKGFDQKIQMVGFNKGRIRREKKNANSLLELLEEITDVPACVSYTMKDGKQMFYLPNRATIALQTGAVYYNQICSKRIEKYRNRGFYFFRTNMPIPVAKSQTERVAR